MAKFINGGTPCLSTDMLMKQPHLWLISGGNKYLLLINKLKIRTQLEVITTQFWNFGSQVDGPVAFYPAKNKFCNFQNRLPLRKQGLNDI